jgi:hypothetical protein
MNGRNQPQNQTQVEASRPSAWPFNQSRIDIAPTTGGVVGRACSSDADQDEPPEEKQGREAEARLFGGIARETQMRPGTPLFKTESYKQDSTATIKESLHD